MGSTSAIRSQLNTFRFMMTHPIGRRQRASTLWRWLRWQLGSRVVGAPVVVPFVDRTRLVAEPGMHGATMNIYVGLQEFDDMSFVLHLLRPGDGFVDVGANVGAYSILAASRGAEVLAVEPVPRTFEHLVDNIALNRLAGVVRTRNIGVGGHAGELRFTTSHGSMDHVLASGEVDERFETVPVETLDAITEGRDPIMLKIDIEGFEQEALRGAARLLSNQSLRAVLVELNGLSTRYGFADDTTHDLLVERGFSPVRYFPFERRIEGMDGHNHEGNTLYVRPWPGLLERLKAAPAVTIHQVTV